MHVSIAQHPGSSRRSHQVERHHAPCSGRSAARTRQAAFWASWADCLPMIQGKHPELAEDLLFRLERGANTPARSCNEPVRSDGFCTAILDSVVTRSLAPQLRFRTWRTETRSFFSSGEVLPRSRCVPSSVKVRASFGEVPKWYWQWCCPHCDTE